MTWDYRIVRRSYSDPDDGVSMQYDIHEAYYDDSNDSKPNLITVDGVPPTGETLQELKTDLAHMILAFDRPVLDYETREEIQ